MDGALLGPEWLAVRVGEHDGGYRQRSNSLPRLRRGMSRAVPEPESSPYERESYDPQIRVLDWTAPSFVE